MIGEDLFDLVDERVPPKFDRERLFSFECGLVESGGEVRDGSRGGGVMMMRGEGRGSGVGGGGGKRVGGEEVQWDEGQRADLAAQRADKVRRRG